MRAVSPSGQNAHDGTARIRNCFVRPLTFLILFAVAFLLSALGPHAAVRAAETDPTSKSIIVLVDGLRLADLVEPAPNGRARIRPHLRGFVQLAASGSVGLMNVRTAGAYNPESARLTFSAASRASAPSGSIVLSGVGRPGETYARRTGLEAPESGFVVLDIASLWRQNGEFRYPLRLGALGEALHAAGQRVTLIAPAPPADGGDMAGDNVPGAAVAMDGAGVVRRAVFGSDLMTRDAAAAAGWRSNDRAVSAALERLWGETDVFILDLPDGRLHMREREWMTTHASAGAKRRAVENVDRVLQAVLSLANTGRDRIMFAIPAPHPEARAAGDMLTPIFIAGPHVEAGGWLSSPTTRRPGLVTITDAAPTILTGHGIDARRTMLGRPMFAEPRPPGALAELVTANERMVATYVQRPPILKSFVTGQIVVWVVALAVLFVGRRLPAAWVRGASTGLQWLLLVTMSLPIALLFASPPAFPATWATGSATLLGALLLAGSARFVADRPGIAAEARSLIPVYVISLSTALALMVDLGRGAPFMQASVLGYDPMVGARYYGIGNEYMGILIGAVIVGATSLEDRIRFRRERAAGVARAVTLLLFGAALLAVALPWWGANVGGALVAATGTAFTTFLLYKGGATWRDLLWAGLVALVMLAALTAVDLLRPGTPSHLGRLAMAVAEQGVGPFADVVRRKVEINLRLLQYSIWSRAFLIAIVVLALRFVRPSTLFQKLNGRFPSLFKGMWGATLAGVVAFAVNDSGVIAAATTTLYASGALLYLTALEPLDGATRADRDDDRPDGDGRQVAVSGANDQHK